MALELQGAKSVRFGTSGQISHSARRHLKRFPAALPAAFAVATGLFGCRRFGTTIAFKNAAAGGKFPADSNPVQEELS